MVSIELFAAHVFHFAIFVGSVVSWLMHLYTALRQSEAHVIMIIKIKSLIEMLQIYHRMTVLLR